MKLSQIKRIKDAAAEHLILFLLLVWMPACLHVCVCVYCPCGSAAHIGDCSTTGCNEKWLASVSAHSKYLYHFRKQPNTPSWIGSVTFLCSQEMLTGASQLWQFLADWSCACTWSGGVPRHYFIDCIDTNFAATMCTQYTIWEVAMVVNVKLGFRLCWNLQFWLLRTQKLRMLLHGEMFPWRTIRRQQQNALNDSVWESGRWQSKFLKSAVWMGAIWCNVVTSGLVQQRNCTSCSPSLCARLRFSGKKTKSKSESNFLTGRKSRSRIGRLTNWQTDPLACLFRKSTNCWRV